MEGMMAMLIGLVSTIMALAIPLLAIYLVIYNSKLKNKENMELIKQGIIPPQTEKSKPTPNKYRSLRSGFLCIGIGLGIVIGFIIYRALSLVEEDAFAVFCASILLCLGIAYVAFYLVVKDKNIDNGSDNE